MKVNMTNMKTIVKITGNVVAAAFVLYGCQSGMYSTSVSVSERRGGMSDYFEVDCVRGLESKVYGERMPVVVSKIPRGRIATGAFRVERKKRRKAGKEEDRLDALCLDLLVSCGNLLGLCSFGVFPFFSSETVETEVCVETPLGKKCGTYSVTAATWTGWLPIFLPYPWFADERVSNPELPHPRLADQAYNRLVANLVSQFPKEDYAAFVVRKRRAYIAEFRAKVEACLAANDWKGVVELCDEEKSDVAFAEDARTRAEKGRVAEFRAKVEERLAANDWVGVVELCDGTAVSEASDVAFAKDARTRAEKIRVAEFRAKVEERLASKDWVGVIELCDGTAVSEASDVAFAKDARVRAEKGRVAVFRMKVEACLAANDWKGVVELCDGTVVTEASDVAFKKDARVRAEKIRVSQVRTAIKALSDGGNWDDVIQLTRNETNPELVKLREDVIAHIRDIAMEMKNGADLIEFIKSKKRGSLTTQQSNDEFDRLDGRYVRLTGVVDDVYPESEGGWCVLIYVVEEVGDNSAIDLATVAVEGFLSALSVPLNEKSFQTEKRKARNNLRTPSGIKIKFHVRKDEAVRRWGKREEHAMRGRLLLWRDKPDCIECFDGESVTWK